jgi:cell fate regulator YaaT (PSP1 superfamily)
MGCSSCGTTAGGKPSGCKSNGGCSTGGCNRLNVHDWLVNLPFSDPESSCKVVEVTFNQGSRKDFFRNNTLQHFEKGELVTVEGVSGVDIGEISLTGEIVRLQLKKKELDEFNPEMKKVLRRPTDKDIDLWNHHKSRSAEAVIRSRAISRQLKLDMKISQVEFQADGRKATFYYIADDRVDFRELIKIYASEFKVKVEMRQIGARQEAAKIGGIGSCGRELCCSTWLSDFKSVNTTAARYQNLSINQTKLSGQCGRLKCCLNYELDTYLDALQHFPDNAETIQVARGTAILIKKDIFKNLMWYILKDSSKQYPLSIERVKKIKQLNAQNIIPEELEPVDVTAKAKETEPEYADLVGQISLRTLEKADRKKRHQPENRPRDNRQRDQRPPGNNQNQPPREQRAQGQGGPQQRPQRDQRAPDGSAGQKAQHNKGQRNHGPQRPQRPGGNPPRSKEPPKSQEPPKE